MVVGAEIRNGSPEFRIERGGSGSTARVTWKIPWNQIGALLEEAFPNPASGYVNAAAAPGFPWLIAKTVEINPFDPDMPAVDSPDWTAWYDYATVVVNYAPRLEDSGVQSGPSGDGSGPGGGNGSTGGQETTFVSHRVSISGEFLQYPAEATQWDKAASGALEQALLQASAIEATLAEEADQFATAFICDPFKLPDFKELQGQIGNELISVVGAKVNGRTKQVTLTVLRAQQGTEAVLHAFGDVLSLRAPSTQAQRLKALGQNVPLMVTIPTLEHTIEWNYVASPPWSAIRQLVGKVNAYAFAGAPSECMIFLGGEASQEFTSAGAKAWKLSYKFTEKNMNPLDVNNPQGWNYFLRPSGNNAGTFQRVRRRIPLTFGFPPTTFLNTACGPADFVLSLADNSMFPASGQFLLQVDQEVMAVVAPLVMAAPGNVTVLRGVSGTVSVAHARLANVTQTNSGVYDLADFRYLFVPG